MLVNSIQGKRVKIRFVGGHPRIFSPEAQHFAESQGFSLFKTYEHLVVRDDVDAIILAFPHSLHAEQVARGKKLESMFSVRSLLH